MKTIFHYTDYRTFLKDYLQMKQTDNKSFSIGWWAKQLQMSSTSVLAHILKGRKNLGKKSLEKFIEYFDFNHNEEEYFCNLVKLHKAKNDPSLSLTIKNKLIQMQKVHTNNVFQFLSDEEFSAVTSWYYWAIREMTNLTYFKEDHEWIASKLHFYVTPEEVEQAIAHLLDLGFIVRNEEGKLKSTNATLTVSEKTSPELIKRAYEQMLQNAKDAIEGISMDERLIIGTIVNIDRKKLPQIRNFISEVAHKFEALFQEVPGNQTYQMNLQLFPLTKKEE